MEPIRPIFWNIHERYPWAEIGQYVLGLLAAALFVAGVVHHFRKWRLGRPEAVGEAWGTRLRAFVSLAMLQARLASDRYAIGMHLAIFYGMAILFLGTALATVDLDVTHLFFGFQFLRGDFYLGYELILDLFAVILAVGLGLAFVRRYLLRPERLKNLVFPTFPLDSVYFLAILFLITVTGLVVEGLRLAVSQPHWAAWSPAGSLIAAPLRGLPEGTLRGLHLVLWCLHALLAFAFIALIPRSKAFHMVSSATSIFLRNLKPAGALPAGDPAGVAGIRDFTWRQLLQFDACTWCGRCQDQCPAHASGSLLSPKNLVLKLGDQLLQASGRNGRSGSETAPAPSGAPTLHDSAVAPAELWACTTCRACEDVCPVFIEQPRAIVDLRRYLVNQGTVDKTLQDALGHLNRYGNSFGKSDRMRAKWTQSLGWKPKDARKEPVEYLWFVGDYASYDPRLEETTRRTAGIFQAAGLDFGLVYEGERNAGNDARRIGEEGLFEVLREKNLQVLEKAQFQKLVTTDPHTYNTLKHEYGHNGDGPPVLHYSEVLDHLLAEGRLPLKKRLSGRVTYHDPCYLGRYNDVYDPPRRVLAHLGLNLVEMPRHRERSFCCGAGGGRIWMEDAPSSKERPAESRVREAAALPGVDTLVVACPKDTAMFRDAVKTTGIEGRLAVRDLADLVWEAMQE
jgi:Fe-S oxidoreductase